MKLIDDERLTEYKFKSAFERMDLSLDYMAGWNDAIDKIGTDLEEESVDAVPVVHGHWIQTQDKDENGNAYYSCSVCGSSECHVPIVDVPFCWKCGSRMDEVTE